MEKKVFLAVTPLDEFWDKEADKIIFTGVECLQYSNCNIWSKLNYEVLESDWGRGRTFENQSYLEGVYKRILEELTKAFNQIHRRSYSSKYWEMIIGFWLEQYLNPMFYRYSAVKKAVDSYDEIYAYGINEQHDFIPSSIEEVVNTFYGDDEEYSLRAYTRILLYLNCNLELKQWNAAQKYNDSRNLRQGIKDAFILFNIKGATSHWRRMHKVARNSEVVLKFTLLPRNIQNEIFRRTNGRIGILRDGEWPCSFSRTDEKMRMKINPRVDNADEFEEMICEMIKWDIPKQAMEDYKKYKRESEIYYPHNPKALFTTISLQGRDIRMCFKAAALRENGNTAIIQTHHHCIQEFCAGTWHELRTSDYFFALGKAVKGPCWLKTPIISSFCTRYLAHPRWETAKDKNQILISMAFSGRYQVRGGINYFHGSDNIMSETIDFLKDIRDDLKNEAIFRLHEPDLCDIKKRYHEQFSWLKFQGWEVPYDKAISNSKIVILAGFLTSTFGEVLRRNIPMVCIYSDVHEESINKAALPYFTALKQIGVLHKNGESVAALLNEIYDDIEGWWNEPLRRKVIDEFLEAFLYEPKDPAGYLIEKFEEIGVL